MAPTSAVALLFGRFRIQRAGLDLAFWVILQLLRLLTTGMSAELVQTLNKCEHAEPPLWYALTEVARVAAAGIGRSMSASESAETSSAS